MAFPHPCAKSKLKSNPSLTLRSAEKLFSMRKVKDFIPFLYLTMCLKTDAVEGNRLTASGTETAHLRKSEEHGNIQWQCKFPKIAQNPLGEWNHPPNNTYQSQACFSQDWGRVS